MLLSSYDHRYLLTFLLQLKKIRSLVIAGATNYDEFYVALKNLQIPLQGSIADLRSQVVREACVTISYLSRVLGIKFDKTVEVVLQPLINLIQNSAKVSISIQGNSLGIITGDISETTCPRSWGGNFYNKIGYRKTLNISKIVFCCNCIFYRILIYQGWYKILTLECSYHDLKLLSM